MRTARRTEAAERDLQDIAFHIAFTHRRPLAAERIKMQKHPVARRGAVLTFYYERDFQHGRHGTNFNDARDLGQYHKQEAVSKT